MDFSCIVVNNEEYQIELDRISFIAAGNNSYY